MHTHTKKYAYIDIHIYNSKWHLVPDSFWKRPFFVAYVLSEKWLKEKSTIKNAKRQLLGGRREKAKRPSWFFSLLVWYLMLIYKCLTRQDLLSVLLHLNIAILTPLPCPKEIYLELMYIATKSIKFSFNIMYQQIDRISMGSPLGAAIASVFVGYYEDIL